jgi:hypothetical protein
MSSTPNGKLRADRDTYLKNRYSFPLDELLRLGDQWVAWSADGTRIVAHDADLLRVTEQLQGAGLTSEDVNFEFIPPGGEGGTQI